MKQINKIIVSLVLIICLLFTYSCNETPIDDESKEKEEIMDATEEMKVVEEYINNSISHKLVSDSSLELPQEYNNIKITWESSNVDKIDNTGKVIAKPVGVSDIVFDYCLEDENNLYYNQTTFTVYPKSYSSIANQFEQQFNCTIAEDFEVNTIFEKYYNVIWNSSNTNIFSNTGKYTKPEEDTEITIDFKVYLDELSYKEFSCTAVIACMSDMERVKKSIDWLNNEKIKDLDLEENIELPTTSELGAEISWIIYNGEDIIEKNGTIHPTVYDRYAQALATISYNSYKETFTYLFKILAKDITKMDKKELLEEFLDTIGKKEIGEVKFLRYNKISATSFNFIDFFDNKYEERIEALAPSPASNVPGTKQSEIKFVCVHDTANNNAGAKSHADYVAQGGGGTSFQYVVGNDGIYHLVENGFVAYHAGDGTAYKYKLYDTGIKAWENITHPIQGISENGYFTLNGVETNIEIPEDSTIYSKICTTGIYMEILPNGNYGLNENYFNTTYNYISNRGGNNNSIGIETCVNAGTDYFKTIRNNIDLVSYLCSTYNLSVDQVLQHNSFSGKPCPDAIRWANYWQSFRDYVSMEKFGMEHFNGLTFNWTPLSDSINKQGYIKKDVSSITEVSYKIEVLENDTPYFSKTYTTIIKK